MPDAARPAGAAAERVIRCPACAGPSVYGPSNPFRPFCGERCKTQDLSAWASERYAVDAKADEPSADSSFDDSGFAR